MKRLLLSALLGLGFLLGRGDAHASPLPADTLKLTSVGGASYGSFYIYPYYISVNGSTILTPWMCISFANEMYLGEVWKATRLQITKNSPTILQEEAFLYSLLSGTAYSPADIQEAAWYLNAPDPSAVPLTSKDPALLKLAASTVAGSNTSFFDNGQYSYYVPVEGSQIGTSNTPQTYVGLSPTPEPNSSVLLATGLAGVFGYFSFRRRQAAVL